MRPRVLVLSRNHPNAEMPTLGLWVEGWVRHTARLCETRVVAPVPYCPPLPARFSVAQFRRIPKRERVSDIEVWHPRFPTGPGQSLHGVEADAYRLGVRRLVDRLWRESPFDLIHAHFTYPDGVAAVALGRRHGVPVVITEHAPWRPWLDEHPRVRRQAVAAASAAACLIAVSRSVRESIVHYTGELPGLRVVPVGVDGALFVPPADEGKRRPEQILYAGLLKPVKGVDVLLRAVRRLVERRPELRLLVMGGGFYRDARAEERRLRALAAELGLGGHVEFTGHRPQREVASCMAESALLVLPSRAESFGAVLVEALACGTPVVATRCGGPEDIVTEAVGALVPPDDPQALAEAIDRVLGGGARYAPERLRAYALEAFSWQRVAERTAELYRAALERGPGGGAVELAINGIRLMGERCGVGRYVEYLLRNWEGLSHPFARICVYTPGMPEAPFALPAGIEHRVIPSRGPNAWWEQVVLGRTRRSGDVLFCPSYVATLPGSGRTVVTHLGSYEALPGAFPLVERWKTRLLYQLSAWRADRVIAVSESAKADIVRFYGVDAAKVTVIPLGVDETRFRPLSDPARLAAVRAGLLGADRPFVLFVGKLSARRNIPALVRAFARLKRRRGLPHALVLVGPNSVGHDLAALARDAGLGAQLVHVPFATHEELVLLYNAADLFVYPSSYEGFGIPVLEAMACGTPAVTLDNSAFPEFAAGVALLAPGASEAQLEQAMEEMLFSPELRRRAREAGPARAREFAWSAIARRTLALLSEVATAAPSRAA